MSSILLAILAALSLGLWTVFNQKASEHVNQVFGAIIVSFIAVLFGLILFFFQKSHHQLVSSKAGWIFIILAGISAFFIDFLTLKAYSSGLSITIAGPIIIGGSVAVAAAAGFIFGEQVTWLKLLGIALIIGGSAILGAFQK